MRTIPTVAILLSVQLGKILLSSDAFVIPLASTSCSSASTRSGPTTSSGPASWARLGPLGVAVDTSDIKNGLTVEIDGEPYKVLSFSIMKQARGAAKTTIKFKNLMRGNTLENTYRSGEKFETALIEKKNAQFTYQDGVSVVRRCLVGSDEPLATREDRPDCRESRS
jgi:hypothetical protein